MLPFKYFALFVCYTVHVIFLKKKYFLKDPGIFIFSIFLVCITLCFLSHSFIVREMVISW